jgi:hypothetical protein
MLFSTVLIWLLIAVGFVVALPALWMLTGGLWPEKAGRLRRVAESGLIKSFLVGLGPLLVAVIAVSILAKLPKMGALAALSSGVLLAWGFMGVTGRATLVGERLWPSAEPWRQVKHGGLTLVCCALLPVVGWFVLLPLMAVIGGGIQVRAWFLKAPKTKPVEDAAPGLPAA